MRGGAKVSEIIHALQHKIILSCSELEAVLILAGAIVPQRASYDDRKGKDHNSSDEEDDDDPSSRMRSAATSTNAKTPKNIRTKDDDSDFEFDL